MNEGAEAKVLAGLTELNLTGLFAKGNRFNTRK